MRWTVAVDAVTVEVVSSLERAGVPAVLLKGPSVARWLYDDAASRTYTDSDILVSPDRVVDAEAVLGRLGFKRAWGPLPHPGMEAPPAAPWRRGPFSVDLHETLPGALAQRQRVWDALSSNLDDLELTGGTVRVLNHRARLLHVALHAAHHGPRVGQPLADLGAALARIPIADWIATAELAKRVGAETALAEGLRMLPEGRRLSTDLGIARPPSRDWQLRSFNGADLATGLDRLWEAPGTRSKALILKEEMFPSREFMRWWSPLARRSSRGLVAAYGWRLVYLAMRMPHAVLVWLRASR